MTKTVLFFGIYDRLYARTVVLKNGFERNGWEVEECHVDPKLHKGLTKYLNWRFSVFVRASRNTTSFSLDFPGSQSSGSQGLSLVRK